MTLLRFFLVLRIKMKYQAKHQKIVTNEPDRRLLVLLIFFIIFALAIMIRLADLQLRKHNYYALMAEGQHEFFQQLFPERGIIFFQDPKNNSTKYPGLYPVAINREVYLVFAVPKEIKKPQKTFNSLTELLEFPWEKKLNSEDEDEKKWAEEEEQKLLARLSKKDDPFEPVLNRVEEAQLKKLEKLALPGIDSRPQKARFYPEHNLGAQIIGFVGQTEEGEKGNYGVEGYYHKELAGEAGFFHGELGNFGNLLTLGERNLVPAVNGADLVLTIDKNIQFFACKELKNAIEKYEAESGSIIVLEPQTGRLLAMCNFPDFDPNKYNEIEKVELFKNNAIMANYEPGSVFKPITMAAALNEEAVDPFTTYNDTGAVRIAEYTITNSDKKAHGVKTMTQVLEESLNTGTVFASRKVGIDKFSDYIKAFGFGAPTDIDLYPEEVGNVSSLDKKHDLYLATASFGQGISVTPIQLITAFATIANGGKPIQPYILDKIIYSDGTAETKKSQIGEPIISIETAQKLSSMLVSVVQSGHATGANIDGYYVAGKTGTAQIPAPGGGYSDETIHSFVGFAPLNNPRFVASVKLDKVKAVRFSASSAAPTFGKLAKYILDYYEIEPEIK